MTGGELQLAAYGSEDFFLTGNPKISFFKQIYRRYTNFSMESIQLEFEGNTKLSMDSKLELRCKLPRYGDLVSNMYFICTLPAIYSTKDYNSDNKAFRFKWISHIGSNIIDNVRISIGGNLIDKHYGEWLMIWNQIHSSGSIVYNRLVGNISELTDPAKGNVGDATNYPDYKGDYPSIASHTLHVPLIFWFNRNPGLALPLISLQNQDVYIHIEIHQLLDLYTIIPVSESSDKGLSKPKNISSDNIGNFLRPSGIVTNIDINPKLEVNYIFLSQEERKKYLNMDHEYLIETCKRFTSFGHFNKTVSINLELQNPVKELVWVAKRNDLDELNQWNNYTNWILPTVAPYGNLYTAATVAFVPRDNGDEFFPTSLDVASTDIAYLQKKIITKSKLIFNGSNRIDSKESSFFELLQSYQTYSKAISTDGIHLYSFAISNQQISGVDKGKQIGRKFQPQGACNMGRINKINMEFEINQPPHKPITNTSTERYWYRYDFYIYATNYNILKVGGGMADLRY